MEKFRKYLRIALPALFIAYLGCLIAFTHVHIVNGVTIVHSHPFTIKRMTAGRTMNMVTRNSSCFTSFLRLNPAELRLFLILLAAFLTTLFILRNNPVYPDYLLPVRGKLSLRAPPVI